MTRYELHNDIYVLVQWLESLSIINRAGNKFYKVITAQHFIFVLLQ